MNKYIFFFLFILFPLAVAAQKPYRMILADTTIESGEGLVLCIDSTRAYSNFIFCAKDPETNKWAIWRKSIVTNKYTPVFNDRYNRMHVKVSADKMEMIYVRYKAPKENAMHLAELDTAWICRGAANGNHEEIVFLVPHFNKNAIYDLDWSPDKQRILFAYGNDQYPNLTRDGDVFEYDIKTGITTNRTNNWELWSNHCVYATDGKAFAYSHYANFTSSLPTDIFVQEADGTNRQITSAQQHTNTYPFCTLTDFTGDKVIYRRGQFYDNSLFEKSGGGAERQICKVQGFGGIHLDDRLYAATDLENSIYLFTRDATLGSIRVSAIRNFNIDNAYNFDNNLNVHLNWLGKQHVKIQWSTGDTSFSTRVHPMVTTTYYCTVTDNGKQYKDTIRVKVIAANRPVVTKKCLTLSTTHYSSYQWLLDGRPIAGATDSAYTPESAGTYEVIAKNSMGKTSNSLATTITTSEAESLTRLDNNVEILPDPSSSIIHIKSPVAVSLMIINEQGKIVMQQQNASQTDMSGLPDGSYSVVLFDGNCIKLKTRKIILQR